MRKAAAAGIILAGVILVAGGLDKESGSENFVADVQANDETTQTEEETDSDPESEEEAALAAQIDTSASVTKGSRIAVVSKLKNVWNMAIPIGVAASPRNANGWNALMV